MRRFTTPTFTMVINGFDLSEATVYVTFKQINTVVTVESPTVTYADGKSTLEVTLTEEQTGMLHVGNAQVQVNWVKDGVREATEVVTKKITDNLLEAVLIESEEETPAGEDTPSDETQPENGGQTNTEQTTDNTEQNSESTEQTTDNQEQTGENTGQSDTEQNTDNPTTGDEQDTTS